MDRKIEIKNKAWYDQKTKELRAVTRELRAFDWMKKLMDDSQEMFKQSFEEMLFFDANQIRVYVSDYAKYKAWNQPIPRGEGLWNLINKQRFEDGK
jgi:hypothetical protein